MMSPTDRHLLLECLRPPEGYRLDHAMGTTYSLDLLALLTAPLAFTFFDWEDDAGEVVTDPLALLEAIRRHADRITMFCQAGEICLPPATQRLNAYLEQSVVEVRAPNNGVFHPKVWLLRFSGANGHVRMRLVCLSRNLTFDRSWDVVLVLDGEVIERQRAIARNHPLGKFIESLPGLAVQPCSERVVSAAANLALEVRRVDWEMPVNVDDLEFWPLGLSTRDQWPFAGTLTGRPMLAISPFLSDGLLNRLIEESHTATVISRPDELGRLSATTLSALHKVYAFDPQADDLDVVEERGEGPRLSGLHAKLYVIDDGWGASVLLGSANATHAAFGKNVEFLVKLIGKKKDLGIEALLASGEGKQVGLMDMLQPWVDGHIVPSEEEIEREQLEERIEQLKRQVAALPLRVDVTAESSETFQLQIRSIDPMPPMEGVRIQCWPSTLRPDRANEPPAGQPILVTYSGLSLDALTGFVAFEIEATSRRQSMTKRFVRTAVISGMPEDRLTKLLASMLQDKEQLMRLLVLLLESQGIMASGASAGGAWNATTFWNSGAISGYPLFEKILKAMVTDPSRLREIGRLIEDLGTTAAGVDLLPTSLVTLWASVKEVGLAGDA